MRTSKALDDDIDCALQSRRRRDGTGSRSYILGHAVILFPTIERNAQRDMIVGHHTAEILTRASV
jgi:hypothetical protein